MPVTPYFGATVSGLNPNLWWPFSDAPGSSAALQLGSVTGYDAAHRGASFLGWPSLSADGSGDTCTYNSGNNAQNGWQPPSGAALALANADTWTIIAQIAVYGPNPANGNVLGLSGPPYLEVGVTTTGLLHEFILDSNGYTPPQPDLPPYLNDGVPHLIGMSRNGATKTIRMWTDAANLVTIVDTSTGSISTAGSPAGLGFRGNGAGNWYTFNGAFANVALFRRELVAADFALLYSTMWGGAPPPAVTSSMGSLLGSVAAANAQLDLILKAVRKTY